MFVARNRLIAALARLTVAVQAAPGSGSLLTVKAAQSLGREVGAVPGPVTSRLSVGPNELLRVGAHVITGAQDVVDVLSLVSLDPGAEPRAAVVDERPPTTTEQEVLLEAIAEGADTASALLACGDLGERCLAVLASLELAGRVSRSAGGRLVLIP